MKEGADHREKAQCLCGEPMEILEPTWEDTDEIINPKEKAFVCPMCEGRKQVDLDKVGMWSPSDPSRFGECPLCDGDGFVVKRERKGE